MCVAEAREDVDYAFRVLEFAIRTMCHFEAGMADMEVFGQQLTINLENEDVTFDDEYFHSVENAVRISQMNVGACFGASAIALDNYFEAVRGQRNPLSDDPVDALWLLVYSIRNAFAHGIAAPRWMVKGKYRRKLVVELENDPINVDLGDLDGREFEYAHIGGFARWQEIRSRSIEFLASPKKDNLSAE